MTSSFPPGSGHNAVEIGKTYCVSQHGTKKVLTQANGSAGLTWKDYTGSSDQKWKCVTEEKNHLRFQNEATNAYLCRNENNKLSASTKEDIGDAVTKAHFQVGRHTRGGSFLSQVINDELFFLTRPTESAEVFVQMDSSVQMDPSTITQLGIHLVEEALSPLRRFGWVIQGLLARSSAPYYVSQDSDQNMDAAAISQLIAEGVKDIISLNEVELGAEVVQALLEKGISYLWSPIEDFGAPTEDGWKSIKERYQKNKAENKPTLVYCGYGHGRTGTIISALQILDGCRFRNLRECSEKHHVEKAVQWEFLDTLQKSLDMLRQ
ncbi:hypothetical protein BFW01_g1980 [Lasiodiplodia theobromae]|nr:hypothetical protein BFW01_g1980 [Lasiodiplodia theobromae]